MTNAASNTTTAKPETAEGFAAAGEGICFAIVELGREQCTGGHLEHPFLRRPPGSPA
jgi:hypothetical protein